MEIIRFDVPRCKCGHELSAGSYKSGLQAADSWDSLHEDRNWNGNGVPEHDVYRSVITRVFTPGAGLGGYDLSWKRRRVGRCQKVTV